MSELKKKTAAASTPPAVSPEQPPHKPSLGALFLAGPVLPICSPSFYRHAIKRSAFTALAFFVIFGFLVAAVRTVRATADFGQARDDIDAAFASGEVPEVTIDNGVATVNAEMPFVAVDDGRSLVVLDTTGVYSGRELEEGGYESGMILTRDAIYSIDDQGRYDSVSLGEIDRVLPFPIEFNATFLKRFIDLAQGFVFLGLFIWHAVMGPLYVVLLALGVWAAVSLVKRDVNFSHVLIVGFFAAVPALYAEYLLGRINADVFLLYTLLLLIFWTVGLVAAIGTRRAGDWLRGRRPLRAWRALIGLPLPIVLALDIIFNWEQGAWITWIVAVITVAALLAVGYYTGLRTAPPEAPGKVAPQG